jgi:hypothetical protein
MGNTLFLCVDFDCFGNNNFTISGFLMNNGIVMRVDVAKNLIIIPLESVKKQ